MVPDSPRREQCGIGCISDVQVTVLRAHNLPCFKTFLRKERRFYAAVTYGERTWRTQSVQSMAQCVEWNESSDTFAVPPLSRISVSLYAEKTRITREDILVGRQDITCESCRELNITLDRTYEHSRHSAESVTLSLTITMSININASSSLIAAVNVPDPTASDLDYPAAESSATHFTAQSNSENVQSMVVGVPLSPTGALPIEVDTPARVTPVADGQMAMSSDLDRAEEAMDTMKTWREVVDVIEQVMDFVSPIVEVFPYAKSAWKLLSKIPETLLHQVTRDDNVRKLLNAIRDAFEFAKEADALTNMKPALTQAKVLIEMLECVSECAKFIISYAKDVQVGTRTLRNAFGDADKKVEQYRINLVRLRDNFLAHASVITELAVLEAELDAKIRELPYKGGWGFDDDQNRCIPGTRERFLEFIIEWVEDPKSQHGLVLLGQAGTGKSSIAHEVARRFEDKCLGCYFTFLRNEGSKDDAYKLFTTLARDLSDRYPAFKLALGKVVKDNSSLRSSRGYRTLFERLLLEPLRKLPQALPGPILIIIDALDESGDATGKIGLHTFLAQHLIDLPSQFRILLTSRPEHGIEPTFSDAPSITTLYMDDDRLASKTEQDICMYLQKELSPDVFKEHGVEIAKAAEGLFQWATVASGFVNGSSASLGLTVTQRVQCLLGHSRGHDGEGLLDNLYEEVLKECFKSERARTLFRSIMGQLLAAIVPLSIDSLIALRRHAPLDDPEDSHPALVIDILRHLGSLLSNATSPDQTRPIVPLHTSFRDFLTNRTSNMFYVDLGNAHHQLAHSCVGLMLDNLKFNICQLESSHVANHDVPDIDSRIDKHIPLSLSYACVFWDVHLKHVAFDRDLFAKLRSLFERKFLFWLEVLSLKRSVGFATLALSSLLKWLQLECSQLEANNLLGLVRDAVAFVRYFGTAMERSAPHIYVSALPFAPSSSLVLNQYLCQFPRTLSMERGRLPHWPALEMTIQAHETKVTCVAFSPDGQRIVSSSWDRTIRVWDAATGEIVADPFIGHTDWVNSVAFSPDGKRIASASNDHTIRVWDAATGEVVANPFTGHRAWVNSVAFSPDGQRVASASSDHTLCVWDVAAGDVVAGPFTGHTDCVNCVAFSPDGQHLASASTDHTIRVWDAETGEVVMAPFTGHTESVQSVTFSPDGQRIASASLDCTIRVWDAATGNVVAGPFAGHAQTVCSVAFSPDGQRIASASLDFRLCLWDVATGEAVVGPFTGYYYTINSVAFSPDGQRIASASYDDKILVCDAATREVVVGPVPLYTDCVDSVVFSPDGQRLASSSSDHMIRVWDAAIGEIVAGPLSGHSHSITSVVFSPDGQRIASASGDCTICVWDATTGEAVADPFTVQTDWVNFVAFSPDGMCIASASWDRTIRVWDATTGEAIAGPFSGHTSSVTYLSFSPDGQRIASASQDCTVRILDATTGEVIAGPFTGHTDWVSFVAFSPDGRRIASASQDCTIRIWDTATGEALAGPFIGHTSLIYSVVFSPGGHRIASASNDGTIRVWDAMTGEVVASPFTGDSDSIMSVAFSPDGQYIASGSFRGVTRVEKITTENIHFTDQSHWQITSDGWICGKDGELLIWIPPFHRQCLHTPNTVWVAGGHETRLDLSKFVHGLNWTTVQDQNFSE